MTFRKKRVFGWTVIIVIVALSGIFYNLLFSDTYNWRNGAVFAVFCGIPLMAFGRGLVLSGFRRWMTALPTPLFIACALIVDFLLISLGFAAAGALLKWLGVIHETWADATLLPFDVLLYALAVSGALVFVMRVRELLGRDVFASLLISRYRHPVSEERVFVFIDLVGSTSFAETHGDLRTQRYLGAIFSSFAEEVRLQRGSIDDYIGDSALITWPMQRGLGNAACVRCVFGILNRIDADRHYWLDEFGCVPKLRAAIHGGPIVTAEIGVDHHKITYFGDTVNTTARLEGLAKSLDRSVLISTDLMSRLPMPKEFRAEPLGEFEVRGRGQRLGVAALERA